MSSKIPSALLEGAVNTPQGMLNWCRIRDEIAEEHGALAFVTARAGLQKKTHK